MSYLYFNLWKTLLGTSDKENEMTVKFTPEYFQFVMKFLLDATAGRYDAGLTLEEQRILLRGIQLLRRQNIQLEKRLKAEMRRNDEWFEITSGV